MSSLDYLYMPTSDWWRHVSEALFPVILPDHMSLNPRWLERFGYNITGDRNEDERMKNKTTRCSLCIVTIVEYIENGIGVKIAGKDREEQMKYVHLMHKYTTNYLAEWREHIAGRGSMRAIGEMADIIRGLDRFNRSLYTRISIDQHEQDQMDIAGAFGIVKFDARGSLTGRRNKAIAEYKEKYPDISKMIFDRQERERKYS